MNESLSPQENWQASNSETLESSQGVWSGQGMKVSKYSDCLSSATYCARDRHWLYGNHYHG